MTKLEKAKLADKIWSDLDTILTLAGRNGTTHLLKTVAIYYSADELGIIRESLNMAADRWYDEASLPSPQDAGE